MAGSFALSMRREASLVTGSSNNAEAMAVAESGLAIAELMLMNPDPRQRWLTDGSIYQIDYANSTVRVQLMSETGKVDINSADQTLLQGMMAYAPVEPKLQTALVNAILDWRDSDDLVRIEGAEKKEYKKAGLSYQPRNKPFQSIEELQLVLGMNEEIFSWLENRVTVYSGQPKVNLTQASKEVLQVLPGMDAGLLDEYIAARRESAINGLPPPVYGAQASGLNGTGAAAGQTRIMDTAPETAGGGETIQEGVMTVVTEAQLDEGAMATIKVLIRKSDGTGSSPFQVLKWQRDVDDDSLFTDEKNELLVRQYAEPEFNN
jgi:general secretion pathway protein K